MTINELLHLYKSELPSYFNNYYDSFLSSYKRDELLLNDDELQAIENETKINPECISFLKELSLFIQNNDQLHLALSYFIYVTVYQRNPWNNYVHQEDLLNVDGYGYHSIDLLIVSKQLAYTLLVKKPPKDLNEENVNAYRGYSEDFYNANHFWGISSFHWNMQLASGVMFKFGILKFCPSDFTDDFPVLKNNDEYVTLVGGSFNVNKKQQLTFNEEETIAKTIFIENEKEITAHVISKDGKVALKPTTFDKSIWKDYLRGGSPTIDIHIPSNVNYVKEEMYESYKQALAFYNSFMPEHEIKAIVSFSWLYSPDLREILDSNSKIIKFQDTMYLIPTLGAFDETLEFLRVGSSLYNKIKEKSQQGDKFHFGIMYTPVDQIK